MPNNKIMSQEDYAASIFVTSILGTILIPVLYCFCKNLKSQSKLALAVELFLISFIIIGFIYSLSSLFDIEKPKEPFNPYEILSVTPESSEKAIRASFRELSKKYHPDKNPDEQDRYLLITKAYEALTDPVGKANYEKYGNPDGPGSFRVIFI